MSAPIETRFIDVGELRFEVLEARPEEAPKASPYAFMVSPSMPMPGVTSCRRWPPRAIWPAPNLRGYGATSTPPKVSDYAIEKLLSDVDGLIDAAGAGPVVLIGHDWGAVISWYYAMHGGHTSPIA